MEAGMSETLETMRALVKAHRPRTWNLGYPEAVRGRVGAYVAARRAAGMTPTAIAVELGLSRQSVLGWSRSDPNAPALVPVEVIADADGVACGPAASPAAVAVLVSPRGYRVEGLDLPAIGALLERLG
jgi:hypothetical protein